MKLKAFLIGAGLFIFLSYPALYFLELNSCRYKAIVNWYKLNHYDNEVTGEVINFQFAGSLVVRYVDNQRHPKKNGYQEIWFTVEGEQWNAYLKIELSQDYKTGKWSIVKYSYYERKFSLFFFEQEQTKDYFIISYELPEPYLIKANNSGNCIQRL
ncbi:hypothetical protein [Algivirga pacifica]